VKSPYGVDAPEVYFPKTENLVISAECGPAAFLEGRREPAGLLCGDLINKERRVAARCGRLYASTIP
jgi:hypothetical protein